ncbi:MAG TPA: glycosyltransferase family 4 protein [Candidatus Methylomirabilis sp.]|nr:glycosyltransferase family 4 protein [Candidatus Methylomirabilis sp.]
MKVRPRLVFVSPLTPADGGNGLAMRAGLVLEALALDHDVSLLVVPVAGPAPTAWPSFVKERTVDRACLDLHGREDPAFSRAAGSGRVAAVRAYPRPSLCRFATDETVSAARRAFAARSFDVVHVMRLYLAPFVTAFTGAAPLDARSVLDLDDDEVETRRRIASLHARLGQGALMALEAAEADKYRTMEAEWLPRFHHLLLSSGHDRAAVAARTGHPSVHTVANGIRAPDRAPAAPAEPSGAWRLLFVGSLGYFPNADAATVLCREVLPRLRARLPRAVAVDVVGSQPAQPVIELDRIPGVRIHADPQQIAPFYARAHATVLPIRAGGGTRLKILEAFAHQMPVISTAIGAEGIAVEPGRHLLIADEPDALAAACANVLDDPALAARLRTEALTLVEKRYDARLVGEGIRRLFRRIMTARPASGR